MSPKIRFCQSVREWSHSVAGSSLGVSYTVHYRLQPDQPESGPSYDCECKGFKYRKKCRHIEIAKRVRCGWSELVSEQRANGAGDCPDCGGPTYLTQVVQGPNDDQEEDRPLQDFEG